MFKRIALTVVSVAAIVAFPAQAHASNGWICNTLESNPNKLGVMTVIIELMGQGYTSDNGGPELFVNTVVEQCPDMIPVVQKALSQLA